MLYAVIARSPVFGGKVARYDATEAMAMPGVVKVVEIQGTPGPAQFQPLSGIAIVAKDTWIATKARKTLKIDWDDGPHGSYDSKAYRAQMLESSRQPGTVLRQVGDVRRRPRQRFSQSSKPSTTSRTSLTPRWSRRPRRAHRQRPLRSVGADAGPAGHADGHFQATRHSIRERDGARHAAGRRIRPQIQAGFRARSGTVVEGRSTASP